MVHHSAAFAAEGGEPALLEAVVSGTYEGLGARLAEMCRYADMLTRAPASVTRGSVEALRGTGLSDRDIVDLNQVVAYFNYVNRIADGLGVELEPTWPPEVRRHDRA